MSADMELQAFHPVMADDKPEFQGAEASAELNVPVTVVEDFSRFGGLVAQIFRKNGKGMDQVAPVGHPEAVAVEIGEQPLVGIETEAVGKFKSVAEMAELGAE